MAVTINGSTGIEYDDNVKHVLGTGDDLEIYHDATNSYISNSTGQLNIEGGSGGIDLIKGTYASGEWMLRAIADGAIELYHNGTKQFETVSGGCQFINDVKFDNNTTGGADAFWDSSDGDFMHYDGAKASWGNDSDLQIYHDGSHSYIKDTGTGRLILASDILEFRNAASNETTAAFVENGAVELYYDNAKKFETESGGAKVNGNLTVRSGTSSQINFYDDSTHTITNYTSSVHLRWWDQPGSDVIMSLENDGDLRIDGSYNTGGLDYAEYFESTDGSAIAVGTTVVLDNGKVRAATGSETPIGVIRPKTSGTSVTGGLNEFNWQGKYLTDDYDGLLVENATFCTWEEGQEHKQCWKDRPPTGVTIPDDAVEITRSRKKLNPSYDASKTYVPRSERVEWNCVGLLGQIPITKGQPTSINWIKMKERSSTVELWMVK